jgi:hypothetical protein
VYPVRAWLVGAAGVGVGMEAPGACGGGGCGGRDVFAGDSIRSVAHCLYALRNSFRSRRTGDCADSYSRDGAGIVDKSDVEARVPVFGCCSEPCAGHRKDYISKFCGLGGVSLVFKVWGPNVV